MITSWFYRKILPMYINIPFSGYKIAVWNCANYVKWEGDWVIPGVHYKAFTLLNVLCDIRVTIRYKDDGSLVMVLKTGRR